MTIAKTDSPVDDPPRGETESYGTPVAEWGNNAEYFEAYTHEMSPKLVFVARYIRESPDDEWTKTGLERLPIDEIYRLGRKRRGMPPH